MLKRIFSAWMAILIVMGITSSFVPVASAAASLDHWANRIPSYSDSGLEIRDVCYSDGRFAAATLQGKIFTSADGTTWNAIDTGAVGLQGIVCDGSKTVSVGKNGVLRVTDLINGTSMVMKNAKNANLKDVAHINNDYVYVGANADGTPVIVW